MEARRSTGKTRSGTRPPGAKSRSGKRRPGARPSGAIGKGRSGARRSGARRSSAPPLDEPDSPALEVQCESDNDGVDDDGVDDDDVEDEPEPAPAPAPEPSPVPATALALAPAPAPAQSSAIAVASLSAAAEAAAAAATAFTAAAAAAAAIAPVPPPVLRHFMLFRRPNRDRGFHRYLRESLWTPSSQLERYHRQNYGHTQLAFVGWQIEHDDVLEVLAQASGEVHTTNQRVPLIDPLTHRQIAWPVRFAKCKHPACFCLEGFLEANPSIAQYARWGLEPPPGSAEGLDPRTLPKCPICDEPFGVFVNPIWFQRCADNATADHRFAELDQSTGTWTTCAPATTSAVDVAEEVTREGTYGCPIVLDD